MNLSNLKLTGNEIALKSSGAPSVLKSLEDTYDQYAKLVFIFDVSYSMNENVARGMEESYLWPTEKMEEIRNLITDAIDKASKQSALFPEVIDFTASNDEDEDEDEDDDEDEGEDESYQESGVVLTRLESLLAEVGQGNPDDQTIKERIIRAGLIGDLNVEVNWEKHSDMTPPSRLEVVKKLARRELESRLKRYPDCKISVIAFSDSPEILFDEGSEQELWNAIEGLSLRGCTNILAAINGAVDVCREKPSDVGVHHFVIVSDGGDSVSRLRTWIPNLRASGVVIDYIHIGDDEPNEVIEEVCKALGGSCVAVATERDLETKFVEAVQRKCLPPPSA